MYITDKQNKGLLVFDTVFIKTIIWLTLSGSPDNGPDKDNIENKCPLFYIYILTWFWGPINEFNSDILCADPKPGHGFQTLYIVGFFLCSVP